MKWLKKKKSEGLSLKFTFLITIIIFLAMTSALVYSTLHTIRSFRALSVAIDTYIDLQDSTDVLLKASDYLTEEAQTYTISLNRDHLENYIEEIEVNQRREKAIEMMKKRLPDSKALKELEYALKESVTLSEREYYAMKLTLLASGDKNIPESMKDIAILTEDKMLSNDEKLELARTMMHDSRYYSHKNMIRDHIDKCIENLKNETNNTQKQMENGVRKDLVKIIALIVAQSVSLIFLLWITTRIGINPLIRAVDHIKNNQKLPITGAHEFRYLAHEYNKMYTAYKKSIDKLSFEASHDKLTGLFNRSGYDLVKSTVDPATTAVLIIDLDNFKSINDENGHNVGDAILKKVAEELKRCFRADDYICRLGGDEFAVFSMHFKENGKKAIENKIAQINNELKDTKDGLPESSISVGVCAGDGESDINEIVRKADRALYIVKENGRCSCHFYDESMD